MAALLSQLPNGASNQVNPLFSCAPPASMIIPTSDSGFPPTFQTLDDVMTSSSSAAMSTSMSGSFYGEPIGVPEGADPDTLDLSGQNLEKLSRAAPSCQLDTTTLILDDNLLQRLDNIHTYQCLEKVGSRNELGLLFLGYDFC